MSSKRYGAEFKAEAVKQVTERGYKVAEVAERLGVSIHSLYAWLREVGVSRTARRAEAKWICRKRTRDCVPSFGVRKRSATS